MTDRIDVLILGAGISGRMAYLELKRRGFQGTVRLCEKNKPPRRSSDRVLTRQFGTNYLWEPVPVFKTRAFRVVTHVDGAVATESAVKRYKHKIGKAQEDPSTWGLQFDPETVGYEIEEYPDFGPDLMYGTSVNSIDLENQRVELVVDDDIVQIETYMHLVVTVPMIMLHRSCVPLSRAFPRSMFKYDPIYVHIATRPPDAPYPPEVLYVNYNSDPTVGVYRYCDRFGHRHFEALTSMGRVQHKKIYPGKIHPHPSVAELRRWLADNHPEVKLFGRFAAWEPDELVHETYGRIASWATSLTSDS